MQQFNLEEWLKNRSRKVVTRDGRPVRIICIDRKAKSGNIVGLVGEDESLIYVWDNYGKHIVSSVEENDLFFADEEPQSAEFSFGAFDSEFVKDEYIIPEGCEARIEGNKVIIEKIQKEEKLTEFEEQLASILFDREYEGKTNTEDDIERSMLPYRLAAKEYSQELIDLARKEILEEFKCREELFYKNGFEKGKEDTLKDLPKWKNVSGKNGAGTKDYKIVGYYLVKGNYAIYLEDLEKLPKE